MTSDLTIDRLRKLYKGYQNPGMAVPALSEYEIGFNQALDLAYGIVMGIVTDRSKTDGNTVTLETDVSTNTRNRINRIISGCMTRGMSSEATTDEVWEYLKLSSEYPVDR